MSAIGAQTQTCCKSATLSKAETIELRNKYIGLSCKLFFRQKPLKIVRGCGCKLYDDEGNEYLDCINNVCHVGHCHPVVVEALCKQAALLNTNSRFLHDNLVIYAQRLTSLFPADLCTVFMVNSGSEATDLALRLAFTHTAAKDVITLQHAYHGHVMSAISVSPYKHDHLTTEGCPSWVHTAPVPDTYRGRFTDLSDPACDLASLYADSVTHILEQVHATGRKPAAFIAESLQSCGGQIIYPRGYLQQVYREVRKYGGVCIADEVQVGFGRTGAHWWAFQTYGDDVVPDIVTLGKPMGNGHPVSAVVTTRAIADSFASTGVEYFNTFGGNPVSCAVALSVLDVIEQEQLMNNCLQVEQFLREGLVQLKNRHACIGDVRTCGMFAGIDLVEDQSTRAPATGLAQTIICELKNRRILLSADGPHRNVLKFKPPLVFSIEDCRHLLENIDQVMQIFSSTEDSQLAP